MIDLEKAKIQKCRFCHRCMGKKHNESHCVVDGWEDDNVKTVTTEICEGCEKYKNRYIEYPLTISGIENNFAKNIEHSLHGCGSFVAVAPCGDEYKGKTYLGIMLGDLPIEVLVSHTPTTGILNINAMTNPAMFVPEINKIIYGCGSWWSKIEKAEDLKAITNDDIENTWYVKMARTMFNAEENKNED